MSENAETAAVDLVGLAEDRHAITVALRDVINRLDRYYSKTTNHELDGAIDRLVLARRDVLAALSPQQFDGTKT